MLAPVYIPENVNERAIQPIFRCDTHHKEYRVECGHLWNLALFEEFPIDLTIHYSPEMIDHSSIDSVTDEVGNQAGTVECLGYRRVCACAVEGEDKVVISYGGYGEVCEYEMFVAWPRGNFEAWKDLNAEGCSAQRTDSPVR